MKTKEHKKNETIVNNRFEFALIQMLRFYALPIVDKFLILDRVSVFFAQPWISDQLFPHLAHFIDEKFQSRAISGDEFIDLILRKSAGILVYWHYLLAELEALVSSAAASARNLALATAYT